MSLFKQKHCRVQKLSSKFLSFAENRRVQSLHAQKTWKHFSDMRFVQNFTPPEFQAKTFTPSISPNFNNFSDKNTKKIVKMEKLTPLAKTLHCRRQRRHGQISPLPSPVPLSQNIGFVFGF